MKSSRDTRARWPAKLWKTVPKSDEGSRVYEVLRDYTDSRTGRSFRQGQLTKLAPREVSIAALLGGSIKPHEKPENPDASEQKSTEEKR